MSELRRRLRLIMKPNWATEKIIITTISSLSRFIINLCDLLTRGLALDSFRSVTMMLSFTTKQRKKIDGILMSRIHLGSRKKPCVIPKIGTITNDTDATSVSSLKFCILDIDSK